MRDGCARWRGAASTAAGGPSPGAHADRLEAAWDAATPEEAEARYARLREALLRYDVYPPSRLRPAFCGAPRVAPGAVIVQRIRALGLSVEAGVRVVEVSDEATPGGAELRFSYESLEGHPERGVASFGVRLDRATRRVLFAMSSWSEPGRAWSRAARPLVRRIQRRAQREALARMDALARS